MNPLEIKVWTIGEAAGYIVKRGNLEIILCSGFVRDKVIAEAKRLAFICNADLYIDAVYHAPSLPPDWRKAK